MMKKFSSLFVVLLLMLVSFTAGTQYPRGDVNYDGQVNITDVTCLIDYLLSGAWTEEPVIPDDHACVDLGLPSGTLWATMNVGAYTPEEYGDYFAWGETEPKEVYDWMHYKWCNGGVSTLTKYCTNDSYGTPDGLTELELEDDAAYVNWGPNWRMPSNEQIQELIDYCTFNYTTINGVQGELVTGPNERTLFFPATGYHWSNNYGYEGTNGYIWSRTVYSIENYAYYFSFRAGGVNCDFYSRICGFPVRAVRVSQD